MIKLSKEEAKACIGFFNAEPGQVLKNGDTGFYMEEGNLVIILCCSDCGEYHQSFIETTELLSITGIEPKHITQN